MNTYTFEFVTAKGKKATYSVHREGSLMAAEDRVHEVLSGIYGEDGYTLLSVKKLY